MSSGYGIGAMGSYASDPAFLAAYSAYNPNFKASQAATDAQTLALLQQAQAAAENQTTTGTQNVPASGVSFQAAPEPSDNSGLLVGGALATAATVGGVIYAAKRGNGEGVIAGLKNIFGGAKKALSSKATKQMKEFTYIAKDGSKVYVKDGKITGAAIRGKSRTLKDSTAINDYLNTNGITVPNYASGKKLSEGVKLTRYTIEHKGNKFVVENGKIIEATKSDGKKVAKDKLEEFIEGLKGKKTLEDRIASIEKGTNKHIDKLSDVRYVWEKDGLSYSGWTDKGTERLTIGGKLNNKPTEAEWKAWLNRNDDINKQVQEVITNGRAEGVSIRNFKYTDEAGNVLFMDDKGEIIKIHLKKKPKTGSQTMSKGTDAFDAWLYDNQNIKELAKKEFETGLAPDGATFIAA